MAYAQGGLIEATHYNTFVGSSPSSATNTINTVWSVGNGSAGYGQTALAQSASQTGLIAATQWATLITTLNSILTHQSGSGSGISGTIVAGNQINYLSTLSTNISTAYTNRLNFASNAAVTVGTGQTTAWTNASTSSTLSRGFGIRAAFGNADQARYFFNAGGRLKMSCSGAQNASTTARTNAAIALLTDLGGVGLFAANTNAGLLGTGGTVTTNNTAIGYHTSTYNANVTLVGVTSTTTSYTSDTATITVITNGTQGSNNDKGLNVDFWITLNSTSGANAGSLSFDDSLGINVTRSVDVSYPETTNLSNTWGAVTITSL
jgi:hypothetical protein